MSRALQSMILVVTAGVLVAGCLEADPNSQKRNEEERRYFETRLETMEAELREGLTNLPAERILDLIGPEVMARQARVANAEARAVLMEDLRATLTVEMDLRCQEMCQSGLLQARRTDREEAEAGRNQALEEIRKLKDELEAERRSLKDARSALDAEQARLAELGKSTTPVSCSVAGDESFQQGLYGDALSKYREALKDNGTPECHRVLSVVYGALGYKQNQAKHLTDYLHIMRPKLAPQQVAMLQAELRAAKR
jgi:tetratricopeptide (TPR) repeat protein